MNFLNRRLRWLAPIEYIPAKTPDNGSKTGDTGDVAQSITDDSIDDSSGILGALDGTTRHDGAGDYERWVNYKSSYERELEAAGVINPDDLQVIKHHIILAVRDRAIETLDPFKMTPDDIAAALSEIEQQMIASEAMSVHQLTDKYPDLAGEITIKILLDRMPRMVYPPWYFGDMAKD